MIIARYILDIISEDVVDVKQSDFELRDARVLADLPARLEEIQENLTDLLPEGYRAQIGGSDA